MPKLSNKTALVTGAGQGIGQGIALALARAGASVVISGRTEAKLDGACASICEAGGQAIAVVGDVRNPDDLQRLVTRTVDAFGGLDILVNNAQQVPNGRLADVEDDAFVAGFESGPLATFRLMKLARPHLAARGDGVIINLTSSVGVRWDMTGYGCYAAVKQAIRSLTRAAAAEWGREGIRVIAVAPHGESPGLKRWVTANPEEAEAFFRTIPLGRIGRLEEDVGRAVVALCSPEMGYLTGATIPLDGGQANFD